MDTHSPFPQIIIDRRKALDMSAIELARRLNVDRSFVSQMEAGNKRPSATICKRIERILSLPAGTLSRRLAIYNQIVSENRRIAMKLALQGIALKQVEYA